MTPVDPLRTTPVEIVNQSDGSGLRVAWRDGHQTLIPLPALRRACPCATCESDKPGSASVGAAIARHDDGAAVKPAKPSALRMARGPAVSELAISRIAGVGRYAVQLFWADGHDTGIYSFELLRNLCPCETCRHE